MWFYGNINPSATYNAWVDPEAARIVFQSGIPLTMVGFDVSVKSSVFTDVETRGELTLGTLAIDELSVWGKPSNATIGVEADEAKFKKMVFDTLKMS